jgi:uncharacterized membrane protein YccC
MGIEIVLVSFFFSMFTVYGNRATAVGNAAILVMILTMDRQVDYPGTFSHALLIFGGGIYYLAFSLLLHTLRPYRLSQRTLGDCVREIATYLSIKADFYNIHTNLEEDYRRLVAQQVKVNEKQDAVRELLFKTRHIVQESTQEGRRLIFTFVKTVDLFEDITAAYYDYASLRKQFAETGSLEGISQALKKIASELDRLGISIQSNTSFEPDFDYDEAIRQLKIKIDEVAPRGISNTLVLRKILVNIRKLLSGIHDLQQYFDREIKREKSRLDHSRFVSHDSIDPKIYFDNFSFHSSTFRHALRVSIACITGYLVVHLLDYGEYSYWVLLTIAFILKPAFSLTKQRNVERLIGTVSGGIIGILILLIIQNSSVLFTLMVLFMIGTYTFMRVSYLVMVIFTTPYVIILFSLLGTGFRDVAEERVFDTVLGCAIAFSASWFLFPSWESTQLRNLMQSIIRANANYMYRIIEGLSGIKVSTLEYKLARKEVYLSSANLSAAFQRMLSEPKSKQKGERDLQQFVVLNHILFSNNATLITSLISKEARVFPLEIIQLARKALTTLHACNQLFGETGEISFPKPVNPPAETNAVSTDDLLIREQLSFINKLAVDLEKTVRDLVK